MRTPFGDIQFDSAREVDSDARKLDERALDRFLERLTDAGCLTLLQWARTQAPHLLRMLMVSFLAGKAPESDAKVAAQRCSAADGSAICDSQGARETATLRAAEQEHIARVVSESRTLGEAASKLGIHSTTLWRKRKLYNLGQ